MSQICELMNPAAYEKRDNRETQFGLEEFAQYTLENHITHTNVCPPSPKVVVSNRPLSIGQYAHLLKERYGANVGRQKLFNYFRREGVIPQNMRVPKREYLAEGLFDVVASKKITPYGPEPVTLITPKGQQHFAADILREFSPIA